MTNVNSDPVIDWLLDAEASIRWQVMRDLIATPTDGRSRAVAGRVGGMGRTAARSTAPRRPMGRRRRHTVLVVEHAHAVVPARPGGRSEERARASGDRSGAGQRHLGTRVRRLALLRGRGRAVHQRSRRRARRILRRAERSTRRSTAERTACVRSTIYARPTFSRMPEAIGIVLERRQADGRWLLDVRHRDTLHEELAGEAGQPNRWVTLRARRVLDWFRPPVNARWQH